MNAEQIKALVRDMNVGAQKQDVCCPLCDCHPWAGDYPEGSHGAGHYDGCRVALALLEPALLASPPAVGDARVRELVSEIIHRLSETPTVAAAVTHREKQAAREAMESTHQVVYGIAREALALLASPPAVGDARLREQIEALRHHAVPTFADVLALLAAPASAPHCSVVIDTDGVPHVLEAPAPAPQVEVDLSDWVGVLASQMATANVLKTAGDVAALMIRFEREVQRRRVSAAPAPAPPAQDVRAFIANWMFTRGGLTPSTGTTGEELLWEIRVAGRGDTVMVDEPAQASPTREPGTCYPCAGRGVVPIWDSERPDDWCMRTCRRCSGSGIYPTVAATRGDGKP